VQSLIYFFHSAIEFYFGNVSIPPILESYPCSRKNSGADGINQGGNFDPALVPGIKTAVSVESGELLRDFSKGRLSRTPADAAIL